MSDKILTNLYQLEKNTDEIRKTVLTNIVKMLTERGLIKKGDMDAEIEKTIKSYPDDLVYKIKTSNGIYAVIYVPQKITSINKSPGIIEFLNNFKKYPKIVVIKEISKKVAQHITTNYPTTEIFVETELMINLIDHDLVPKHEMLTSDEMSVFFEKYNCKKRNMPKLLTEDPVAKYYNMKPGDIVRIIRPSEKTGEIVSYRLVVKGAISV